MGVFSLGYLFVVLDWNFVARFFVGGFVVIRIIWFALTCFDFCVLGG